MCGIAGIFHRDRQHAPDAQRLANMAAIQQHRGPDGFGTHVLPGRGVGFAHARLSIIDLDEERARQPFVSADGQRMLAHNGEFYDFKRLRADLSSRGRKFATKSDSELVLHLYPELGLDRMLRELRGEFAFALYDGEEDALYLVRDRFGIKPLYWTLTDEGLVFGSELKVLFADPRVRRRFDEAGLLHQLIQTMVPGRTAFEGVEQVKPGHVLVVRRRGETLDVREERYWDFDFPEAEAHENPAAEEESIETVRAKLIEAVELRLKADVPVGCYLSGGIDSCAILGLAAAASQNPVKAFTIGFDDADYDESPIARQMAESVTADQELLRLSGADLYGHFERTLWHTERTVYNTLAVAKLLMSQRVRETGYKVVLTGEGSDELFAGYPSFRRDLFAHGLPDLPADERRQWEAMLGESNALFRGAMLSEDQVDDPALDAVVGFTPACLQPWLACTPTARQLLVPELREQLADYHPGEAIAEALDPAMLEGRHPLDRAQYVWSKTMLEGQILTWGGDRVDMANSMEARPAFLDHHLAEAAVKVPPLHRIKGRREKHVLREAVKGVLPRVLYEREKFAFMAPPAHTDPGKWRSMMTLADEYLSDAAVERAGILDRQAVRNLLHEAQQSETSRARKVQLDAVINHALGVQILHRQFIERDLPAEAARMAADLGWKAAA